MSNKRDYSRTTLNDLLISVNVKMDLLKTQLDEIENIIRKIGYMKVEIEQRPNKPQKELE